MIKRMNVGDILDHTFSIYRNDFKSYWTLVALGIVPAALLNILSLLLFPVAAIDPLDGVGVMINSGFFAGSIIFAIVGGILQAIAYGGLIKKSAEQIAGGDIEANDAFKFGVRKIVPALVGGLLVAVAVFLGFLALIIPGIYLIVSFAMYFHTIIIEDEGPLGGIRRSRRLIKGYWWRSLGVFILIGILTGIIASIVAIPFGLLSGFFFVGNPTTYAIVNTLVNIPVHILITPLTAIAYTLYYYDLRVRQENLDLDMAIDGITTSNETTGGA
ncbi:hypothetical protein [Dethiobacter alkaliphilus]|uniref:DUF7847 domain-containing protein n=1 Tax=Dethiobacter alkaliphilus AHT 1 TaxID=555088 RepID=C0GFK4_DETAL|nr:hypothetical protein [Dethiobacter alkaliphilus]EEG77964.1 hypothetical protein DealDRAFT_1263 [Dethiobacter alkaliphilus AHT 1]